MAEGLQRFDIVRGNLGADGARQRVGTWPSERRDVKVPEPDTDLWPDQTWSPIY